MSWPAASLAMEKAVLAKSRQMSREAMGSKRGNPKHSPAYPDEAADGRQGIAAVVPSIGHQRARLYLARRRPGVPKHPFLDHDGDHSRHKRDPARDGDGAALGEKRDMFHRLCTDAKGGDEKHSRQHKGGNTFDAFMAVGMSLVRLFVGKVYSD